VAKQKGLELKMVLVIGQKKMAAIPLRQKVEIKETTNITGLTGMEGIQ
jgi:hypothetical protein